jgi:excinuclease ABC subunit A
MNDKIKIKGAREHNLKNVHLEIPRDKMVVFTGLSGSGKSSLAFDTVFAEGQRRYIESLSAYARQFLGKLDKPDVDEIEGLSPAISIDQKSHSANPRSTVATITEIYDYLRVLYARAGKPHCPLCGKEIRKLTKEEIVDAMIEFYKEHAKDQNLIILSPVVRGRKGEYYQMLYDFLNSGFSEARIDGEYHSLRDRIQLSRNKQHTIELVVDRLPSGLDFADKDDRLRLAEAIENALKYSNDVVTAMVGGIRSKKGENKEITLSAKFSCPNDEFAFPEIEPRLFSFNSPFGACPECHGLGTKDLWSEEVCAVCLGKRLKPEALSVLISGKSIVQATNVSVEEAFAFFEALEKKLDKKTKEVADVPLREIRNRLRFLNDVGLEYLTLDRKAGTLSGGEGQRIRLASQIGSRLVGTLYILDEPTIGLHQRDNDKLIMTLLNLRDLGNTIIVVEHDEDTIRASDYLVDFGPGAGVHGGQVVAQGAMPELLKDKKKTSLTLEYLRGEKKIEVPKERRSVEKGHEYLKIRDAHLNNLKNIDVDIPLRRFVAVTGVSGSGKSTLVYDVLYKTLANKFNGASFNAHGAKAILGLEYINRVINIDQSPIGRTPRSNPATYVGAWTFIRDLFASTDDARVRGYKVGRFSFNVPGGRCENCEGHGTIAIEMHFLPTVYVECDVCKGKRFDRETLEVEYKGKNIYDILRMTIEEGVKFFHDIPWLHDRLTILNEVGLGYLELGQPATTLSGGEAQRVKLAAELGKRDTRRTLYLLDEPTTGLHFEDIKKLLEVLQRLVSRGNTVVVIEHNLDVIKSADWMIDLGPEGGERGGTIVAQGTPEDVSKRKEGFTSGYLRKTLK